MHFAQDRPAHFHSEVQRHIKKAQSCALIAQRVVHPIPCLSLVHCRDLSPVSMYALIQRERERERERQRTRERERKRGTSLCSTYITHKFSVMLTVSFHPYARLPPSRSLPVPPSLPPSLPTSLPPTLSPTLSLYICISSPYIS